MKRPTAQQENRWLNRLTLLTLVFTVLGGAYYLGRKEEKIESRLWKDVDTRVKGEAHVENAKTEAELYDVLQKLDTVADITIEDARENLDRDSVRDDLVNRNAVEIYNQGQSIDTIKGLLKEYIDAYKKDHNQ